jgi:hydrogenase nickel incorporation protein HypA/HybF
MHEMSLCENIIQIIEDNAHKQNYNHVKTIWLEIGKLSSIEVDAMHFGFDAVSRDTIADGARLEIIQTPGQAWCMQCSQNVEVNNRFDACPLCGGYQLQITAGDEMKIKELEVE